MQQTLRQRVALISTGSELVNGEIHDTNAPYFAQQLTSQGIAMGEHIIVSDEQPDIEVIIEFLLSRHGAVIICGGLGPTSDDRTRYALANVLNEPLQFDENVWLHIQQWLNAKGISAHPDNQRQAFFPKSCTILDNHQGTAVGCYVQLTGGQYIFVLPGPPKECRPMFDCQVLPFLKAQGFTSDTRIELLKFIGVIETEMASQVDELAQHYQLQPAYRVDYPYLDVKVPVRVNETQAFVEFANKLKQQYLGHWVSNDQQDALALLNHVLTQISLAISLIDPLTEGRFRRYLESLTNVNITPVQRADLHIEATALCKLSSSETCRGRVQLHCRITYQGVTTTKQFIAPKHSNDLPYYALHFLSFAMYEVLIAPTSLTDFTKDNLNDEF